MVLKFVILFMAAFVVSVNADCILYFEGLPPHFIKEFGSKQILLNKITASDYITLDNDETIFAFCPAKIQLRQRYGSIIEESRESIELKCNHGNILYKTLESQHLPKRIGDPVILCDSTVLLHESHTNLPDCEKYESYAIGNQISNDVHDLILAGICYDLTKLQLQYATYVAYRSKYEFVTYYKSLSQMQPAVTLDVKVKNLNAYFNFMSENTFALSYDILKNTKTQLGLFNFDFTNLIQDAQLNDELKSYADIFNIVWWRNLRLGNWRNFLNAFEERTQVVKYMVYAGSSGELEMPTPSSSCNNTEKLQIEAVRLVVKPPKYIWYYISSLHENITENVVVIGYNSPFYDQRNASNIIFCKDVCDEIDWLTRSSFIKLRLMPTMGLVFCCRAEDIGEQLANFPHTATKVAAIQVPVIRSTTASITTTEIYDREIEEGEYEDVPYN